MRSTSERANYCLTFTVSAREHVGYDNAGSDCFLEVFARLVHGPSFVHSSVRSFIHSFIRSYVRSLVYRNLFTVMRYTTVCKSIDVPLP